MTEVTRCSCWHQNFVPKGLSAPSLGLYTCIKSWKKTVFNQTTKSFFLKFVVNDRLPLTCGYTYLLNHEKMCIKSGLKRFFLNLQQMTIVIRPSCWHTNFGPNGLSAPTLGLCLNFFSSTTTDFNISSGLASHEETCLWKFRGTFAGPFGTQTSQLSYMSLQVFIFPMQQLQDLILSRKRIKKALIRPQMCKPICAFAVCLWHKQTLSWLGYCTISHWKNIDYRWKGGWWKLVIIKITFIQ